VELHQALSTKGCPSFSLPLRKKSYEQLGFEGPVSVQQLDPENGVFGRSADRWLVLPKADRQVTAEEKMNPTFIGRLDL
jgi:hypothetical protein